MKNILLFSVLFISLFFACNKTEPPVEEPSKWVNPLAGLPDEGLIRWDDLKIGQRSRYLYYEALYDFSSGDTVWTYYPDTFVMAITGQDSLGFVLKEFTLCDSSGKFCLDTTVFATHLRIEQDSLKCIMSNQEFSLIFNWVRSLPLTPFAAPLPEYPDAIPLFDYSTESWEAFTQKHAHFGRTYGPLNLVYDYREMAWDGAGLLFAYDKHKGLVRFSWVSYWNTSLAKGFDLLEE